MPEGPKAQKLAVVIPAGGVGTRFGGRLPKQFVRLGRGSILTETVAHFTRHPAVIAIVVAAPEIHVERTRRALVPVTRRAPVLVVQGGGMRQDSVWLALQAVPRHADIIIVHDAVRPLITRGLIDAVVGAGAESGAVTRVGFGFDLHPLEAGRPLVLGGVTVDFDRGLAGHSDGDVLSHAVAEALLGALALGDLGRHFPDTDPRYRGISSLRLLRSVVELVTARGGRLVNVDATV